MKSSPTTLPDRLREKNGLCKHACLLFFLILLPSSLFSQICTPPPSGLIGWWAGEGNALDSFGTNHGTLQGGAGFTTGQVGQAFNLNGTNQYIQVPDSAAWDFGTNNFSIELWARFNSPTGSQVLVAHDQGSGAVAKWLFWMNSGLLQMHLNGPISGGVDLGSGAFVPVTNQWYHIAVTRNGSVFSFYTNGVLSSAATNSVAIPNATAPLTLGQAENTAFLRGSEDEISIYNRALSGSEILAIYNAGTAGKCPLPPVIAGHPTNQVAAIGDNATFAVTASGAPPLSYQWKFNGTNVGAATNASLILTNVQSSNSGAYSVLVTNLGGSTNSSNATLTIILPGECVQPPSGLISWWAGESNALDSIGTNNGILQNGASYAAGKVDQAFNFNVNGTVVVPDSVSLRLTNLITIECWINPAITNGDQAVVSKVGFATGLNGYQMGLSGNQLFGQFNSPGEGWPSSAIAKSLPFVLGSWQHVAWTYDQSVMILYFNGQPVATNVIGPKTIDTSSTDVRISGADDHGYFNGLVDEAGLYNRALTPAEILAIYNAGSEGKCPIPMPPVLVGQPASQAAFAGDNVSFEVTASGSLPLSHQWKLNGTNISLATNNTFTLTNVQINDAGNYSVLVTNSHGSTNSSNATLTVLVPGECAAPPSGLIGWWAGESNALDSFGTNHGMLQGGTGFVAGKVGLAFSFDGVNDTVSVPDSSSLRLTNQITIECWINPTATNGDRSLVSKITSAIGLSGYQFVLSGNQLIGQFNSPGQGWPSSSISHPLPLVLGAWNHVAWTYDQSSMNLYFNGQPVATNVIGQNVIATSSSDLRISGNDNVAYFNGQMDEVSIYDRALNSGEILAIYLAGAAGKCGAPLVITSHPTSQILPAGSNATFNVSVSGSQPVSYQWKRSGTNIVLATNASFTLTNVQVADAADYSVFVTNAVSSTNSTNATLTVNPAVPVITLQPQSQQAIVGANASFAVAALGSEPFGYQWKFNSNDIPGANSAVLSLTNLQFTNVGDYSVVVSNSAGATNSTTATLSVVPTLVIAWGYNGYGQTNVPANLGVVAGIGAGQNHSLVVRSNGTAAAWGNNASGQTNVPAVLSNATRVAGGGFHSLASRGDGTAIAWGDNSLLQTNIPAGLSNVATVAGGVYHSLALQSNGAVAGWGNNNASQISVPVSGTNATAVAAGGLHSLALKSDGTVIGWGYNNLGQVNVPPGLSNIVAVGAGYYHSLALRANGTVAAWGYNAYGQTNIPVGLTNVVAIAAGYYHNLALKSDGTIVAWGDNSFQQANVPAGMSNVVAIAGGGLHSLALVNDGAPFIIRQPLDQTIPPGSNATFSLTAIGTPALTYQWRFNGTNLLDATNSTLGLTNVPASSEGAYSVVVGNSVGSVTSSNAILTVVRTAPQFDTTFLQFTTSGMSLKLFGLSGHGNVIVYASSNLVDWQAILTNPPVIGELIILDFAATNLPVRFYRALEQ